MNSSTQGLRTPSRLVTVALATLLGLAGCGGKSDDATFKARTRDKPEPSASKAAGPVDEDARLANAVVSGKTSAPVDLKYDLAAKPVAGLPFEIELVFQPRLPADTLEVEVSGMAGLTVAQQGSYKFDKVQQGTPYTQKITVQADADGTYYVSVIARMITQIQTEVRTFSVPVVVGTAPAPVAKPAPQTDASGQAIESMPATEKKQ